MSIAPCLSFVFNNIILVYINIIVQNGVLYQGPVLARCIQTKSVVTRLVCFGKLAPEKAVSVLPMDHSGTALDLSKSFLSPCLCRQSAISGPGPLLWMHALDWH